MVGAGTTLFSAVKVKEDIELVRDAPDPDGEIKVMVNCWYTECAGTGTWNGWVGSPVASPLEISEAIGIQPLTSVGSCTLHVRRDS